MESKKKLTLLIALFIFLGIGFYWFQVRPVAIKKQCFDEVYGQTNTQWAKDKEWMYYKDNKYGWVYPYWRLRDGEEIYKGCLIYKGLN